MTLPYIPETKGKQNKRPERRKKPAGTKETDRQTENHRKRETVRQTDRQTTVILTESKAHR